MCSVFGESWPVDRTYSTSRDKYRELSVEDGFKDLVDTAGKRSLSVEEVVGFLDAYSWESNLLIDKLRNHMVAAPKYDHPILRYLTSSVKVKAEKIKIQRSTLRNERELKDFVEHLLRAVYKVELQVLKTQLLQSFPQSGRQVDRIIELDRSFYQNMDVFGKFMDLAPNDGISKNPWFAAITSFLFSASDPVLSHRLNLHDYDLFKNDRLSPSVKKRLLSAIIASNTRRQIFWGSVISAILLVPTNVLESKQSFVIAEKQASYIAQNTEQVVRLSSDSYKTVLNRILNEKILFFEESLSDAKKVNDVQKVEAIEAEISELKRQLL